jgi:hypothetical protein
VVLDSIAFLELVKQTTLAVLATPLWTAELQLVLALLFLATTKLVLISMDLAKVVLRVQTVALVWLATTLCVSELLLDNLVFLQDVTLVIIVLLVLMDRFVLLKSLMDKAVLLLDNAIPVTFVSVENVLPLSVWLLVLHVLVPCLALMATHAQLTRLVLLFLLLSKLAPPTLTAMECLDLFVIVLHLLKTVIVPTPFWILALPKKWILKTVSFPTTVLILPLPPTLAAT